MAEPVGKTYVELGLNMQPLEQGLKEAEASVRDSSSRMQDAGAAAGAAGEKAAGGFKGAGDKIKGATLGIRTFTSALTTAVGLIARWLFLLGLIAAAFRGLIGLVRGITGDIRKAAEAQAKYLEAVRNTAGGLRKASDLAEVLSIYQKATEESAQRELEIRAKLSNANQFTFNVAALQKELDQITKMREDAARRAQKRLDEIESEASDKRVSDASTEINRIAANLLQQKADRIAEEHRMERDAARESTRIAQEAIDDAADAAREAFEDAEREAAEAAKRGVEEAQDIIISSLSEEEQVRARHEKKIEELRKARSAAESDADRATIDRAIGILEERTTDAIARIRGATVQAQRELDRAAFAGAASDLGAVGSASILRQSLRDILREVQRTRRTVARGRA